MAYALNLYLCYQRIMNVLHFNIHGFFNAQKLAGSIFWGKSKRKFKNVSRGWNILKNQFLISHSMAFILCRYLKHATHSLIEISLSLLLWMSLFEYYAE